jgi:CubicO group peptidase (beta-lactamase class C family)
LILLDEGRFGLDDPIAGCAPELVHMCVLPEPDGPLEQADEATRPTTFRDCQWRISHTPVAR